MHKPDRSPIQISDADRARIAALRDMIEHAEAAIAAVLAPYLGASTARVVHDHPDHAPPADLAIDVDAGATLARRTPPKPKLIAVVDYDDGNGYACYYDPPGVCRPC